MSRAIDLDVWKNRPKALLVKGLMKDFNFSLDEIATIMGTSVSYLNNKFSRNSFTFEDLLLLFHAANLKIEIKKKNDSVWKTIALRDWYPEDADKVDEKMREVKRKEYLLLMDELKSMKELYGFED